MNRKWNSNENKRKKVMKKKAILNVKKRKWNDNEENKMKMW